MRVLVLVTAEYGRRHVENLEAHLPEGWSIATWQTPRSLPLMMDYYDEWLPESLDPADLILSLAELPGVAEFIPDLVKLSGAQAVIAPIDSQAWPFSSPLMCGPRSASGAVLRRMRMLIISTATEKDIAKYR